MSPVRLWALISAIRMAAMSALSECAHRDSEELGILEVDRLLFHY